MDESFLDKVIENQRQAMRYYRLLAAGVVAVGVAFPVVAFFADVLLSAEPVPPSIKTISTTVGLFVGSLSAIPVKEIIRRKEKISVLESIRVRLRELGKGGKKRATTTELQKIDDILWKLLEKTALG